MTDRPRRLAILRLLVLLAAPLVAQDGPRLTYFVEPSVADAPEFRFALEIERPGVAETALSVAAWAPGSYRLLQAWEGVKDVAARDETGAPRVVAKRGDLTWVVRSEGAAKLRVTWRFDALDRRRNNRSYLTKTGGLLDGPRCYLYWRDRKDLPMHVRFATPEGWTLATGLTPTFDPAVFVARDADRLLDCPVLFGKLEERAFSVRNVPIRAVFENAGEPVGIDWDGFVDGLKRIIEASAQVMGDLPYEHYSFLFTHGGGGLEHLTSTTIGVQVAFLRNEPHSHDGVIAHEHFHAWNVKRLRPKALGPFDYDGPARTNGLWISEGITNYYTNIMLARAGFRTEDQFFAGYRGVISAFVANPASVKMSPEEASWTVWDSAYMSQPVSYYDQGEILGLLMDLEIRGRTGNRKSFDDAMRALYAKFSGERGFQSEDVVSTILESTGVDLHEFFLNHVSAARPIDFARYLRRCGYLAGEVERAGAAPLGPVADVEGGVRIDGAEAGTPAARLGLKTGDVLTTLNGRATRNAAALARIFRKLGAGDAATLVVLRGGREIVLTGAFEAGKEMMRSFTFKADPDATAEELAVRRALVAPRAAPAPAAAPAEAAESRPVRKAG